MSGLIPEGYKMNAAGHLVPVESIKEEDLLRDEFVREMIKEARILAGVVAEFKERLAQEMQAFLDMSAAQYGASLGGPRGNVTLTSFDGRFQILRAVSDTLDFNEKLQAAKSLIDDCLREWTKEGPAEVRALIDQAFQVDKKGRINAKRILGLRSLKIEHPVWQRAMEAIADAIHITGSRVYFRFYERDDKGNYQQIPLDFSGV
jgi:hypothetical protein